MVGTLTGCGSHIDGQTERATSKVSQVEIVTDSSKTPDKILFKGINMILIESDRSDLKPYRVKDSKESCLNEADEQIRKKMPLRDSQGAIEYSVFEAVETNSFGSDKFTVNLDKNLFSSINPDALKTLDKYVGLTDFRQLYFIKNENSGYLLLIGHASSTSGMGHNFREHLLVPLDSNRPTIEFSSISDDPRRIRIANSNTIHYVQIELDYESVKQTTKRVRLIVSLFTVDSTGNKRLGEKFNFDCASLNDVFESNQSR